MTQKNDMNNLTERTLAWAERTGIADLAPHKQLLKTMEELGEVAGALVRGKEDELKDGIGDVFVTIAIVARQAGLSIEDCVQMAVETIEPRKGLVVDGVFIKYEDLPEHLQKQVDEEWN